MVHRILVIEDEEDIQVLIRRKLKREGYEVEMTDSGEKGIVMAREKDPDLILLDVMLPDKEGYEVCSEIRNNGYQGRVIIYTAKADAVDAARAREVGADDFTVKTEGLEAISRVIKEFLDNP